MQQLLCTVRDHSREKKAVWFWKLPLLPGSLSSVAASLHPNEIMRALSGTNAVKPQALSAPKQQDMQDAVCGCLWWRGLFSDAEGIQWWGQGCWCPGYNQCRSIILIWGSSMKLLCTKYLFSYWIFTSQMTVSRACNKQKSLQMIVSAYNPKPSIE